MKALTTTRPQLLALDLDGTLLGEDCRLPEAHREALARIRAMAVRVAIVTGRPLTTSRWLHRELALDTPMVCFNGVWIGSVEGEALVQRPLEEHEVHHLIQLLAKHPGAICVYPGIERWLMHQRTPRTLGWDELYGVTIEESPWIMSDWQGPSCKVMFVAEPELLPSIHAEVSASLPASMHCVISQADRMEIHRAGATKGWGLEQLAAHLDIPQAAVWAAGDAANDLEMLLWAGVGCAMGQAPATVQSAAQIILPPIQEHGLAALPELIASAIAN